MKKLQKILIVMIAIELIAIPTLFAIEMFDETILRLRLSMIIDLSCLFITLLITNKLNNR